MNITPWELESRDDREFWIVRAVQFKSAEGMAERIAMERVQNKQEFRGGTS